MKKRLYIISYDLKFPGRDYTPLYTAIKSNREWQHPLESCWIVYTSETADDIYNSLKPTLDNNDLLFISELTPNNRQGWMPKTCWEWLNSKEQNV